MTKIFFISAAVYTATFTLAGVILLVCTQLSTQRFFANDYTSEAEAFCQVFDPAGWTFDATSMHNNKIGASALYSMLGDKAADAIHSSALKAVFADYLAVDSGTNMADFVERGFSRVMQKPWECEPMRAFEQAMVPPADFHAENSQGLSVKVIISQQGLSIGNTLLNDATPEAIEKALSAASQSSKTLINNLEIDVLEPNKALFDRLLVVAGKLKIQRIRLVEH